MVRVYMVVKAGFIAIKHLHRYTTELPSMVGPRKVTTLPKGHSHLSRPLVTETTGRPNKRLWRHSCLG